MVVSSSAGGRCTAGGCVHGSKKVKLSSKKITVYVGKTKTLKLKNNKKKAKWTVISGKKNIKLKSKKNTSVRIVGKKKGTAKVQAKVGKKKYVCTVSVKAKSAAKKETAGSTDSQTSNTQKTTPTPGKTAEPTPTPTPPASIAKTPGLYDLDMNLLYSWDELIENKWIIVSEEKVVYANCEELVGA